MRSMGRWGVSRLRRALRLQREEHPEFRLSPPPLRGRVREGGARQPEGPARAYLLVIDRNPKAVQEALAKAS